MILLFIMKDSLQRALTGKMPECETERIKSCIASLSGRVYVIKGNNGSLNFDVMKGRIRIRLALTGEDDAMQVIEDSNSRRGLGASCRWQGRTVT